MDLKEYERKMRREARRVLQKKLRRVLCPGEACHHIDGNFTNNNPENLEAVDARAHLAYHSHGGQVKAYKKNLLMPGELPSPRVEFISTTQFLTASEMRRQQRKLDHAAKSGKKYPPRQRG